MGRCPNHKKPSKNRYSHKSARRSKFLVKGDDLIHQDIQKQGSTEVSQPLDEDLPGLGQFYCLHCDRYFGSGNAQNDHFKTKRHKKRVKTMQGPVPHTQLDADLAAGMGRPDNGPRLIQ